MLTSLEERTLISLLKKLDPVMSADVFNAVVEKFILTAIENVVLREKNGEVEILMIRRDADDKYWPMQWHNPGTIIRTSDYMVNSKHPFELVFQRVQEKEIKTKYSKDPIFVDFCFYPNKRCGALYMIFICEIEGEPNEGQFFNINDIPKDSLQDQIPIWDKAVRKFKEIKGLNK